MSSQNKKMRGVYTFNKVHRRANLLTYFLYKLQTMVSFMNLLFLLFMARPVVVYGLLHFFAKQHNSKQVRQGHYNDSHG